MAFLCSFYVSSYFFSYWWHVILISCIWVFNFQETELLRCWKEYFFLLCKAFTVQGAENHSTRLRLINLKDPYVLFCWDHHASPLGNTYKDPGTGPRTQQALIKGSLLLPTHPLPAKARWQLWNKLCWPTRWVWISTDTWSTTRSVLPVGEWGRCTCKYTQALKSGREH